MSEYINKQRLFNYFDGKASALEIQQIEEWSHIPVNQEQFYEWLDEWEKSHLQYKSEEEYSLERYRSFLFSEDSKARKPTISQDITAPSIVNFLAGRRRFLIWAAAAVTLIVGGLFGFQEKLLIESYETAYGETRRLTLEDGSSVILNANSSLKVPRFGFGSTTREVVLHGEALFSVIHKTGSLANRLASCLQVLQADRQQVRR
jgi:transmembrane sensor